jgi:hypothetical protein
MPSFGTKLGEVQKFTIQAAMLNGTDGVYTSSTALFYHHATTTYRLL